jgi:hypothetical protein
MAIHVGQREFVVMPSGVAAGRPRIFVLSVVVVLSQVFLPFAGAQQMANCPASV